MFIPYWAFIQSLLHSLIGSELISRLEVMLRCEASVVAYSSDVCDDVMCACERSPDIDIDDRSHPTQSYHDEVAWGGNRRSIVWAPWAWARFNDLSRKRELLLCLYMVFKPTSPYSKRNISFF